MNLAILIYLGESRLLAVFSLPSEEDVVQKNEISEQALRRMTDGVIGG